MAVYSIDLHKVAAYFYKVAAGLCKVAAGTALYEKSATLITATYTLNIHVSYM